MDEKQKHTLTLQRFLSGELDEVYQSVYYRVIEGDLTYYIIHGNHELFYIIENRYNAIKRENIDWVKYKFSNYYDRYLVELLSDKLDFDLQIYDFDRKTTRELVFQGHIVVAIEVYDEPTDPDNPEFQIDVSIQHNQETWSTNNIAWKDIPDINNSGTLTKAAR